MSLSILQPARAAPKEPPEVSVNAYFEEQSSSHPVVFFPKKHEFSGDSSKVQGEQAEKQVYQMIEKAGQDIPGIKIICFHGVRLIGGSPSILREVDFCSLITYKGRHSIVIKEVKCNANDKGRKSGDTRKKALSQLRSFKDMLGYELKMPVEKIQMHAVWPNMPPTELCPYCKGLHPSLYERPIECQQPGAPRRNNPEEPGVHLFKDKFIGQAFSRWLLEVVCAPELAVDHAVYNEVLNFLVRSCVGVLYDELVKSCCILGEDQAKLVNRKEQPLAQPTVIYGLGGTGKTISILARIQRISGKLSPSCRALYLCFEDNVKAMVEMKLKACRVDLTHITIENVNRFSHNVSDFMQNETIIPALINEGYRYVYLDSAEDLGLHWINQLLLKQLEPVDHSNSLSWAFGDFWITFDPFQGLQDTHSLVRGIDSRLKWRGTLINSNLLDVGVKQNKFVKLEECFRIPKAMIDHIEKEKVIPIPDLPRARDVKSLGVVWENIDLPMGSSLSMLANKVADQLHKNVMLRGIHPGHCAVLFHGDSEDDLFPHTQGGLKTFLQLVNSDLRAIPTKSHAMHMLQLTQNMQESSFFGDPRRKTLPAPSLPQGSFPLVLSPGAGRTVEYNTERHNQVFCRQYFSFTLIDNVPGSDYL